MTQTALPGIEPTEWGGDLDFFETPSWAVELLLPHLPWRILERDAIHLLEPSAGRGAILRAANPVLRPRSWAAVELDVARGAELSAYQLGLSDISTVFAETDFLRKDWSDEDLATLIRHDRPNLIIGNPPYSKPRENIGFEFVERCLELGDMPSGSNKAVVAMLLQLDFAAGVERAERIHDKHKSALMPLRRRPSFDASGSGKRPYAWFVWDLWDPKSNWGCL